MQLIVPRKLNKNRINIVFIFVNVYNYFYESRSINFFHVLFILERKYSFYKKDLNYNFYFFILMHNQK